MDNVLVTVAHYKCPVEHVYPGVIYIYMHTINAHNPEINYSPIRNSGGSVSGGNMKQEDDIARRITKKMRRNITATRLERGN